MNLQLLNLEIEPNNRPLVSIDHLPSGRTATAAFGYIDPFDRGDVLENVLDAETVVYMDAPPEDELDRILQMEAHIAQCEECARLYRARICAHCLQLRICEPVTVLVNADATPHDLAYFPLELLLCRQCRNSAHKGQLRLSV